MIAHDEAERSTRELLIAELRQGTRTVDELAAATGITPNGVRSQLAGLMVDGTVIEAGIRRAAGPGKPATLYRVSIDGEARLSRAYAPALRVVLAAVQQRFGDSETTGILRDAGAMLAATAPSPAELVTEPGMRAAELLRSLGALVRVTRDADGHELVEGAACPLEVVVKEQPRTCELVRELLASATGAAVTIRCEYGERSRCCFAVAGGENSARK